MGHYKNYFEFSCSSNNQEMSLPPLLAALTGVKQRIQDDVSPKQHNWGIVFHAYGVVTYVVSLCDTEGCGLLNLDGGFHKKRWGKGVLPTSPSRSGEGLRASTMALSLDSVDASDQLQHESLPFFRASHHSQANERICQWASSFR
jgi:hypothetical protein